MQELNPKELLFAKIALEQGFLEKQQIQQCIDWKKKSPTTLGFDELLFQLKLLTEGQIKQVKALLNTRIRAQTTHTKEDLEDNIFGQLALQSRYVAPEHLRWALAKQKEYEKIGVFKRMGEILVESNILTAEKVQHILEHQRKRILICPSCHSQYNINASYNAEKYQCKKCGKILEVPKELYSVKVESSILLPPSPSSFSKPSSAIAPPQKPSSSRPSVYDLDKENTPSPSNPPSSVYNLDQYGKEPDTVYMNLPPNTTKSQFANKGQSPSSIRGPQSNVLSSPNGNKMFGHYEILNQVARGGMGVVYRARDCSLDRIVALKTLLAGEHATPETIQRFMVEARSAAKLKHPNIVAIYEVGNIEGQYFFTMDYIEGEPFNKQITSHPAFEDSVKILIKVCQSIYYAHSQGIIHRDLKPSNIIIDKKGEPQVMDFGLAKQIDSQTDLTQTGATIGTPSYMAPEQASGYTDQIDHLSDIYSLGCILYEALTYQKPFDGQTSMSIIYQVITQDPPTPRKVNPQIPRDLETIILKAMDKEKSRRYDSAQEMAEDLKRYLQGETIQARPTSPFYKAWKKMRKNKVAVAVSSVCFVVLLVVGLLFFQQYQKEKFLQRSIKAQSLLKEGQVELAQGKLLSAQKILEQAISLHPDLWEAHICLAEVYRKSKEFDLARKSLEKAFSIHPKSAQIHFESGRLEEDLKNLPKAIECYSKAIKQDSSYIEAYERRKKIYEALGKMDLALQDSQTLVRLQEKQADLDLEKARKLMDQGGVIEATYHLNKAILWRPKDPEAYMLRARCHQALNDGDRAIKDINQAVALSPQVKYYLERAHILVYFGQMARAIADYQKAVDLDPKLWEPHVKMGWIYSQQQQNLYALTEYKKAMEKGASSFEFYQGYGTLYLKLRRYEQALKFIDLALQKKPKDLEAIYSKGVIFIRQEEYQKGIDELSYVYEKTRHSKVALEMAKALVCLGKHDEALKILKELKEVLSEVSCEKARIYLEKNNLSEAMQAVNEAIQNSSSPQSSYYELRGDIYFKMESFREAFEDFATAQDVDWRNYNCFYKILYTSMAGFLWHEAIERIGSGRGKNWLTTIVRRQWSYEKNLFDAEEKESLSLYLFQQEKKSLDSPQSNLSAKSIQDALSCLRSGVPDMERISREYLLKIGKPIIPFLQKSLSETSQEKEKVLLNELLEKIQSGREQENLEKVLSYLVRIHIQKDITGRKQLYSLGQSRGELLKKILLDEEKSLLVRLYAASEIYDLSRSGREKFLEEIVLQQNSASVLAAIALVEGYQSSAAIQKSLMEGIFSKDSLLSALAMSQLSIHGQNLNQIQQLMEESKDLRFRLMAASKIFLFNSDPSALKILGEALKWEDPNIRIYICQTLAKTMNPQVLPYIWTLLEEKDPEVRLAAVVALRMFTGKEISGKLMTCLKDPSPEIRLHTLTILERMTLVEEAGSEILNILGNPKENFYVRLLAFLTFKKIRNFALLFQFVGIVPKLVEDPNPVMRMLILFGISIASEDKQVQRFSSLILSMIKKGLEDPVPFVRGGAIFALALMNEGRDFKDYFYEQLEKNPDNILGVSSASALVILSEGNKISAPGLFETLQKGSPLVRKGAAYGYWYVAKEHSRKKNFKDQDALDQFQIASYTKSYQLASSYYYSYLSLADVYKRRGNMEGMHRNIDNALQFAAKNPTVFREVGDLYEDTKNIPKALEIYDQWIKYYPNDYRPYYYKGTLLPLGEEKMQTLRYALLVLSHPTIAKEYTHKISILEQFGLEKEAWDVLNRGVLENGEEELYVLKIKGLMKRRRYKETLQYIDIVEKMNKNLNRDMIYVKGVCKMKERDYENALAIFRRLWATDTGEHRFRVAKYTAYCLEKLDQPEEAKRWYSLLVNRYNNGEAFCAMGMFYQRQDLHAEAQRWFRQTPNRDLFYCQALALISLNYALQERNNLHSSNSGNKAQTVKYLQQALDAGFKGKSWLREQYGFKYAIQIAGFKNLFDLLEED